MTQSDLAYYYFCWETPSPYGNLANTAQGDGRADSTRVQRHDRPAICQQRVGGYSGRRHRLSIGVQVGLGRARDLVDAGYDGIFDLFHLLKERLGFYGDGPGRVVTLATVETFQPA